MIRILFILVFSLILSAGLALFPQTTLWQDHNPYAQTYETGDLITVEINEKFSLRLDNKWENGIDQEMTLVPDRNYMDFLKQSEQSQSLSRDSENKTRIQDSFAYTMAASVTQKSDRGILTLEGTRVFRVDDRNLTLRFSGRVREADVKNAVVSSARVSDMQLLVNGAPDFPSNNQVGMKTPEQLQEEAAQVADLSEQEKQQILLDYLRRVTAGANP